MALTAGKAWAACMRKVLAILRSLVVWFHAQVCYSLLPAHRDLTNSPILKMKWYRLLCYYFCVAWLWQQGKSVTEVLKSN